MRVAPVGVLYPSNKLDELVKGAYQCAIPTHGGPLAVCAAAAVAGAVSAAIEGKSSARVLTAAVQASKEAESLRYCGQGSTVAGSILEIHSDLAKRNHLDADEIADEYFPDRPETIVPLAISLALVTQSAQETAVLAANIGGDSDSVASIGSAIAGALQPKTVNDEWFDVVSRVNSDEIATIDIVAAATMLAALRGGHESQEQST